MQPFSAQIIPLEKVNRTKWDTIVAVNDNGLIYSSFTYLNLICTNCLALVINDYEAILPLPVKRKFGLRYLYIPPFVQQSGLIGKADNQHLILQHIKQCFKYGDIFFNYQNDFVETETGVTRRNNFIIDLNTDYTSIKKNYHSSVNYSLHKAEKAGCAYISSNNIEEGIALYQSYNEKNLTHVTDKDFFNLLNLCNTLSQQDKVLIRKVINHKNELLSLALLLKDNKRYYNLINYTSPQGRQTDANYFLYDNLFKELAHQNRLFDFEGSNIEGIKNFYEKFGAHINLIFIGILIIYRFR